MFSALSSMLLHAAVLTPVTGRLTQRSWCSHCPLCLPPSLQQTLNTVSGMRVWIRATKFERDPFLSLQRNWATALGFCANPLGRAWEMPPCIPGSCCLPNTVHQTSAWHLQKSALGNGCGEGSRHSLPYTLQTLMSPGFLPCSAPCWLHIHLHTAGSSRREQPASRHAAAGLGGARRGWLLMPCCWASCCTSDESCLPPQLRCQLSKDNCSSND